MSFRQCNKKPETVWRKHARPHLLAAGVPDFLIDDEKRWNYVVLHGDDLESGWNPLDITKGQAADLLRLIEAHYPNRSGLDLFPLLQKRITGV